MWYVKVGESFVWGESTNQKPVANESIQQLQNTLDYCKKMGWLYPVITTNYST